MVTINPHYDAEQEQNRLQQLEDEREMRNKFLMQNSDFIVSVLTDEVPQHVLDTCISQIERITMTQDTAHIDAAYRVIGRCVAEWVAERAWKASAKK